MTKATMAVLALVLAAGFGLAQEKKAPPAQNGQPAGAAGVLHVRFADVDANKDGKINKAELEAYFARLDTETDGGISQAEFNAAAAAARGCAGAPAAGAEPKKK